MNSLNFMLTFSHVLSQVAFSKLWNGWNRRTHGNSSTYRRSLFRSLNHLLPLCNEDTSPVTPALIISGCDRLVSEL
ncbi:hypothetical protein HanIR_Chr04g0177031 [Helianthus annuus]|nr:hypothetical protein HanIR_Chr04g0177031 [Helianthus annuus]